MRAVITVLVLGAAWIVLAAGCAALTALVFRGAEEGAARYGRVLGLPDAQPGVVDLSADRTTLPT